MKQLGSANTVSRSPVSHWFLVVVYGDPRVRFRIERAEGAEGFVRVRECEIYCGRANFELVPYFCCRKEAQMGTKILWILSLFVAKDLVGPF